jgi:hypothetical protein
VRKYDSYTCSDVQRSTLREALKCLQLGHFFAAHDLLEELFKGTTGDGHLLFHGLAQIAAAHHQLTLGRARAAVRTWHKARLKLERIDMLSPSLATAMDEFYAGLGIDQEGPRFIDVAVLGPAQSFPLPLEDTDHTPSA